MGRVGLQKGKCYPYKKCVCGGGGAEQDLAMLKGGGGTKCFEIFLTQELEVSSILMGDPKSSQPLKGEA